MQSINATEGITRVIGRNSVYDDFYDMYYSGDVVSECPIYIKFFGEDGVDFGEYNEIHFGRKHIPSSLKGLISLFLM